MKHEQPNKQHRTYDLSRHRMHGRLLYKYIEMFRSDRKKYLSRELFGSDKFVAKHQTLHC